MEKNKPILDGIDPELMDRLVSRRQAIMKGATVSSLVAAGLRLGSIPAALAVLAKDVGAQTTNDIVDALKFAFILENFENEFYKAVLGTSAVAAQNAAFLPVRTAVLALGAPGQAVVASLTQIQKHEQQHVDFLKNVALPLVGQTAVTITANDFDFTGGNGSGTGPFARATQEIDFLLLVAQAAEDLGVRAYKGQAGRLLINSNNTADIALESALRIHSVEARHAAKLRRIRRSRPNADTAALRASGTVRGAQLAAAGAGNVANPPGEVVTALNLIYGGGTGPVSYTETNTSHVVFNDVGNAAATINAATLTNMLVTIGDAATTTAAAQEAFDEALTKEEVIAIVQGFIKDDAGRGLP